MRKHASSINALSRDTGASYPAAQGWYKRNTPPSPDYRTVMANVYGIPTTAWDDVAPSSASLPPSSPSAEEPAPKAVRKQKARKTPKKARKPHKPSGPRRPSASSPKLEGLTTIQGCRQLLSDIRFDLDQPNLTSPTISKLRRDRVAVLNLLSRLEKEGELLEDRVVDGHPRWIELKRKVLSALEPYPEAAQAVVEALTS